MFLSHRRLGFVYLLLKISDVFGEGPLPPALRPKIHFCHAHFPVCSRYSYEMQKVSWDTGVNWHIFQLPCPPPYSYWLLQLSQKFIFCFTTVITCSDLKGDIEWAVRGFLVGHFKIHEYFSLMARSKNISWHSSEMAVPRILCVAWSLLNLTKGHFKAI